MFEEPETVAKWTDECYWVKTTSTSNKLSSFHLKFFRIFFCGMGKYNDNNLESYSKY